MSTITLSYLVMGESPYENAFQVVIDTTQIKTAALFKDAIKEKIDDNVKPADEHIHIIVQRSVETKEKKLCEYFTFPDGIENEHIVIGRVVGGASLKRKISIGKMRKKLDLASSSSQSASDTVEIVTECKVIQFSADEDLLSIIWTVDPKVDLKIVVDTSQQPFSLYTFSKMKVLFGLKVNSYDQLPCIEIGSSATPEEIKNSVNEDFLRMHKASSPITSMNEATHYEFISAIIYSIASIFNDTVKVYPQYEVSGSHGKGPIDWVIKMEDVIISITEAK
ncbi:15472_t:CDS:2 [Funneliformis mosseae]|uniref:15472_t:CDS:1 n=1 Tax=Funneliformis mosseae TaxID=27381 RepID=A0A9N9ECV5_FUNMO|nr:15472_t:CDS:2 [Funneliformis mosseae]